MSKKNRRERKAYNMAYNDAMRDFFREEPKSVDGVFNSSSLFYDYELLKLVFSAYEIQGAPEWWDYDYMMQTLFKEGFFCITDTAIGVVPLRCSYHGINVWGRPTEITVANPVLQTFTRRLPDQAALVKLQYDFRNIFPLIQRYSTQLAMCDSAVSVNLMNSKASIICQAESKAQAATFQKMFDEISAGKPFVVIKDGMLKKDESVIFLPVKQAYIADDVMILKRKIMNEFLSRIGINNANIDKRQRLNLDEVNANDEEIEAAGKHWIKTVNEGLKEANRLYGLNLEFVRTQKRVDNSVESGDNNDESE